MLGRASTALLVLGVALWIGPRALRVRSGPAPLPERYKRKLAELRAATAAELDGAIGRWVPTAENTPPFKALCSLRFSRFDALSASWMRHGIQAICGPCPKQSTESEPNSPEQSPQLTPHDACLVASRRHRFLVIGGTGFTGTALVEDLVARGARHVRSMSRSAPEEGKAVEGVEYVRGSFTSLHDVRRKKICSVARMMNVRLIHGPNDCHTVPCLAPSRACGTT